MASNDTPKTVLLKGDPLAGEALAGGAISPGDLIAKNSAGAVVVHGTASAKTAKLIARELEITGKGLSDNYASADQVIYWNARSGDEYYMFLQAGEDVAIGDLLESAGDGTLQAVTTGGEPLFEAVEALDLSGTGAVDTRMKVMAL